MGSSKCCHGGGPAGCRAWEAGRALESGALWNWLGAKGAEKRSGVSRARGLDSVRFGFSQLEHVRTAETQAWPCVVGRGRHQDQARRHGGCPGAGPWGGRARGDEGPGLYASGCRLPAELRAKDTGAIQHLSAVIQGGHNELNALRCVNTELLFGLCVPGLSQSFCWAGLSPPASQGQGRLDPG